MTFAEKFLQLRKREGYSQEELADKLSVSRQAISRWEMGTAMPDSPNLLQISKLFGVSADYLLNDEYESDNDIPAVRETCRTLERKYNGTVRIVIGSIFASLSAIGMLVMGIIGSVGNYTVAEARPEYGGQTIVKTGFPAFLESNNLEWLFILCILVLIISVVIIVLPIFRYKKLENNE